MALNVRRCLSSLGESARHVCDQRPALDDASKRMHAAPAFEGARLLAGHSLPVSLSPFVPFTPSSGSQFSPSHQGRRSYDRNKSRHGVDVAVPRLMASFGSCFWKEGERLRSLIS